jgi:hypothetical protein
MTPAHYLLSLNVLITPLWILIGSAMGIHALWTETMSRRRQFFLIGYGVFSLFLISVSWWNAGVQEANSSKQQKTFSDQSGTLNQQSAKLDIITQKAIDDDNLIRSLTTLATTQATQLNDIKSQVANISASKGVNTTAAAKDLASQVAKRLASRVIDDGGAQKIISELKSVGSQSITVTTVLGDPEAFQYATRIIQILKAGGWQVSGPDQSVFSGPVLGLIIQIADKEHAPKAAGALQKIFHDNGIDAPGQINSNLHDPSGVVLIVGSKPPE